ncbi:MAG: DUF2069 domain-containing protein [Thermomonas sp.]|uniref:DUF2069 domain-containing protein n=1 Tax=Thermomonas sp. TaxID=1971895 RepID=UPI0039E4EB11
MNPKHYLALVLCTLAALYGTWLAGSQHLLAGLLVCVLPPVLLAIAALRGWHRAGFTASVFALLWFSHGVMLLWSEPGQRVMAALEVLLALVVIHAACLPGIRARRARNQHKT